MVAPVGDGGGVIEGGGVGRDKVCGTVRDNERGCGDGGEVGPLATGGRALPCATLEAERVCQRSGSVIKHDKLTTFTYKTLERFILGRIQLGGVGEDEKLHLH